jgi:hypothetical protein
MQLVEFDDAQGFKVWVNPTHVASVKRHTGNQEVSDIHLINAQPVRVAGRLADVIDKLNAGLKS